MLNKSAHIHFYPASHDITVIRYARPNPAKRRRVYDLRRISPSSAARLYRVMADENQFRRDLDIAPDFSVTIHLHGQVTGRPVVMVSQQRETLIVVPPFNPNADVVERVDALTLALDKARAAVIAAYRRTYRKEAAEQTGSH